MRTMNCVLVVLVAMSGAWIGMLKTSAFAAGENTADFSNSVCTTNNTDCANCSTKLELDLGCPNDSRCMSVDCDADPADFKGCIYTSSSSNHCLMDDTRSMYCSGCKQYTGGCSMLSGNDDACAAPDCPQEGGTTVSSDSFRGVCT
jgi:hypothetical protein